MDRKNVFFIIIILSRFIKKRMTPRAGCECPGHPTTQNVYFFVDSSYARREKLALYLKILNVFSVRTADAANSFANKDLTTVIINCLSPD